MTARLIVSLGGVAIVAALLAGCGGGASTRPLPSGDRFAGPSWSLIVPSDFSGDVSHPSDTGTMWTSARLNGGFVFATFGAEDSLADFASSAVANVKDKGLANWKQEDVTLPAGPSIRVSAGKDAGRAVDYAFVKNGVGFMLMCMGMSDELCDGIARSVTLD